MKKLLVLFSLVALAGTAAQADEQDTVKRSAEILREFRSMPERQVPRAVLRNARGLAIMRVVKVGFVFSGKGGDGVVIARTGNGWSAPSFIGTGGAGWGLQIGAQVTDFVFVLNNSDAVRAFSRGGNVTLGGDISAAAGPVGRDVQANVAPKAAIYTYSLSKGLFAGVSLEGAVIVTEKEKNARYYGRSVTASQILNGKAAARQAAPFCARPPVRKTPFPLQIDPDFAGCNDATQPARPRFSCFGDGGLCPGAGAQTG
jgi:lipid-binding SYLF domain-containing protein